jgi:hypothetical protein
MQKLFALLSLVLLTMSAWAANTYVKVTSLDQLEAGQKYILVNEEANVALGAITGSSTTYGSAVAITVADGVIDIDGTAAVELTIGEGSLDQYGNPTWTFDMGSAGSHSYLIWTSGNSLNTATGLGPVAVQWLATVTDDGVVLANKQDNTRKLQYNAGAPRFACYTSSQKPAVLFVQGVPGDDGIANLNEANRLEDNTEFTFAGNAVVTLQSGNYLFLRDESGYGMINGAVDGTFVGGEVLTPGWTATKTSDDGWVKYTDATGISASGETNAALAAAQKLTGAVDETMLNAYVYIENVNVGIFPPRLFTLGDGSTIWKSEILGGINWSMGGHYNVYGIIVKDGGDLKFNPLSSELYVEPTFIRGDVDGNKEVNISDVILLINYLSGLDVEIDELAADCSLDEQINITDAIMLINYLSNNVWPDE